MSQHHSSGCLSCFKNRGLITLIIVIFNLMVFGNHAVYAQKPLRILLITGGCCHNYPFQSKALQDAVAKYTKAEWTVITDGGTGTEAMIDLYKNADWGKGYDLAIHNECFADTKDTSYIKKITAEHLKGLPAVVIHCAMHTYRTADTDEWRKFLGVTSRRHDHQSRYPVKKAVVSHYITKELPAEWLGPKDELYIIEKVWPRTQVLATAPSEVDGKVQPVMWTNQYGKARVFGTTFGHSDEMFKDTVYINLVARGILWAASKEK